MKVRQNASQTQSIIPSSYIVVTLISGELIVKSARMHTYQYVENFGLVYFMLNYQKHIISLFKKFLLNSSRRLVFYISKPLRSITPYAIHLFQIDSMPSCVYQLHIYTQLFPQFKIISHIHKAFDKTTIKILTNSCGILIKKQLWVYYNHERAFILSNWAIKKATEFIR